MSGLDNDRPGKTARGGDGFTPRCRIRELRPCDGRSTGAYFGQGLGRKQNFGAKVRCNARTTLAFPGAERHVVPQHTMQVSASRRSVAATKRCVRLIVRWHETMKKQVATALSSKRLLYCLAEKETT
jgi:hypothetical protein